MSTRGLVGIKVNNEKKYMFNHWDSYPKGGLGEDVVAFCNKVTDWDTFKANAEKVKMVDEHSKPTIAQIHKYLIHLHKL